jgi:hypothetical protein
MEAPRKFRTKKLLSFADVPKGFAGNVFKVSVCVVILEFFLGIRAYFWRGRVDFEPIQPLINAFGVVCAIAWLYIFNYGALKFVRIKAIRIAWFTLEAVVIFLYIASPDQVHPNGSNYSSDSTPPSVTPAAGQPPRQP